MKLKYLEDTSLFHRKFTNSKKAQLDLTNATLYYTKNSLYRGTDGCLTSIYNSFWIGICMVCTDGVYVEDHSHENV